MLNKNNNKKAADNNTARKYGTVLYLDLSNEVELQQTTFYGFDKGDRLLKTKHLVGFSNNKMNQLNGLPIVHVFPANTRTANVPPEEQHTQSGAGLAIPYERTQDAFRKAYYKNPTAYNDIGIFDPEITVIGFPTVVDRAHQGKIDFNNPMHAKAVFEHFIAGMYFQLGHANLCIPVIEEDLDQFLMPTQEEYEGARFPEKRRAAFGGTQGVATTFLPKFGEWFHKELFDMDAFINHLANATTLKEQETLIRHLYPPYKEAFRQGRTEDCGDFYGIFDEKLLCSDFSPLALKKEDIIIQEKQPKPSSNSCSPNDGKMTSTKAAYLTDENIQNAIIQIANQLIRLELVMKRHENSSIEIKHFLNQIRQFKDKYLIKDQKKSQRNVDEIERLNNLLTSHTSNSSKIKWFFNYGGILDDRKTSSIKKRKSELDKHKEIFTLNVELSPQLLHDLCILKIMIDNKTLISLELNNLFDYYNSVIVAKTRYFESEINETKMQIILNQSVSSAFNELIEGTGNGGGLKQKGIRDFYHAAIDLTKKTEDAKAAYYATVWQKAPGIEPTFFSKAPEIPAPPAVIFSANAIPQISNRNKVDLTSIEQTKIVELINAFRLTKRSVWGNSAVTLGEYFKGLYYTLNDEKKSEEEKNEWIYQALNDVRHFLRVANRVYGLKISHDTYWNSEEVLTVASDFNELQFAIYFSTQEEYQRLTEKQNIISGGKCSPLTTPENTNKPYGELEKNRYDKSITALTNASKLYGKLEAQCRYQRKSLENAKYNTTSIINANEKNGESSEKNFTKHKEISHKTVSAVKLIDNGDIITLEEILTKPSGSFTP